jgi:hypothetical protein
MEFGTKNYSRDNFSKYGQIAPNEDPVLTDKEKQELRKLTGISDDDFQTMQESAKDQETFNQNLHLPKGVFSPTSSKFNPDKLTIVISFTEDLQAYLLKVLDAIDKYFKLDRPAVTAITNKFNILVAWSTSCVDMIKTLKKVQQTLGDKFSKARFLFLNDLDINNGSGQFYENSEDNSHGDHIPILAEKIFSIGNNMRTLIQTGKEKRWQGLYPRNPDSWSDFLDCLQPNSNPIDTLTQNWQNPGSEIPCSDKLSYGISNEDETSEEESLDSPENQNTPEKKLAAIHVPVQAFVKALKLVE